VELTVSIATWRMLDNLMVTTADIVRSVALEQLPDDEDCCRKTNDDTDQRDDGFVGERHAV
jgi:hypothetical protein